MKPFVLVGKSLLFLASMLFIAGLSLFVAGSYFATWPLMRLSPRNARVQTLMSLAVAAVAVLNAYGLGKETEEDK